MSSRYLSSSSASSTSCSELLWLTLLRPSLSLSPTHSYRQIDNCERIIRFIKNSLNINHSLFSLECFLLLSTLLDISILCKSIYNLLFCFSPSSRHIPTDSIYSNLRWHVLIVAGASVLLRSLLPGSLPSSPGGIKSCGWASFLALRDLMLFF